MNDEDIGFAWEVGTITPRKRRFRKWLIAQDNFYPVDTWPGWAQDLVYRNYLSNASQFSLAFFLLANGLDTRYLWAYVLANDIVRGVPTVVGGYDRRQFNEGERHIMQMIAQHDAGTLYTGTKLVRDMSKGGKDDWEKGLLMMRV